MIRSFALAGVPLLLVGLAACGGDSDDEPTATPAGAEDGTPTDSTPAGTLAPAESPTPTPETPLPTPTRVADTEPLMVVNFGETMIQPTAGDLAALDSIEITGTDGETYEGVSLAALAAEVSGQEAPNVEVRGIRSDGVRLATVTYSLTDSGEDTVIFVAESGNANLASASIPEANWLTAISSIAFY